MEFPDRLIEPARRLNSVLRGAKSLLETHYLLFPEMESIYRSLFLRDLGRYGVEDEFYPIGSAANHSLMYLVARCLIEFPIARVLEFGAGQTSILLDRLSGAMGRPIEITTVEQDPFWAERIRAQVHHPVICAPLAPEVVADSKISFYRLDEIGSQSNLELVIVDGPTAYSPSTRWDRIGAVEFLKGRLASEFIVIFDDTERAGEFLGTRLFCDYLVANHITHYISTIRAAKQQKVICSEQFRAASYF